MANYEIACFATVNNFWWECLAFILYKSLRISVDKQIFYIRMRIHENQPALLALLELMPVLNSCYMVFNIHSKYLHKENT